MPTATLQPPLPPPRQGEAMAYDGVQNEVLTVGGDFGFGATTPTFLDQWELDARGWHELHPTLSPPPGWMAQDPVTGDIIMVSGSNASLENVETWSWDGSRWTRLADLPATTDRAAGLAVLDDQLVLVTESADYEETHTWIWTGSAWAPQAPLNPAPGTGVSPVIAADPAHHRIVALFLIGGTSEAYATQTWVWDGTTWNLVSSSSDPGLDPPTASMATDPQTGSVLLYQDPGGGGPCTWELTGSTWRRVAGASPDVYTAYNGARLLTDPLIGRVILVGGPGEANPLNTLWVFDGSTWRSEPSSALVGGVGN
ncbi:MAG: hypothetical protein WCB85_08475 [Candidatus Dormiibacterota bacterium]